MKLTFRNFLCFVVAVAALLPMLMVSIVLLGQQEQTYGTLTLGFVLTLLLTTLMVMWLMRKIRRPFHLLSETLQKFSQGHYSVSSEPLPYQEFSDIQQLLNSMGETIQHQLSELVKKNRKLEKMAELRDEYLSEVQLLNVKLESRVDAKTAETRAALSREENLRSLMQGVLDLSAGLQRYDDIPLFVASCISGLSRLLKAPVALYIMGHKTMFDSVGVEHKYSAELLLQLKSYDRVRSQLPQKFATSKDEYEAFHLSSRYGKSLGVLLIQSLAVDKERQAVFQLVAKQIGAMIETIRLTTELEQLARTDELTRFLNRKAFNDSLIHAKQLYLRYPERHIGLFVIDANGLKIVNDRYGHDAGDEFICCLGHILEVTCRQSDQVFRLGGDEFAILVEDGTLQSCDCLMSRLAQEMDRHFISIVHGETSEDIQLSFSVGFSSTENSEVDDLFKLADQRMYQQKQRFYDKLEKLC